MASFLPRHAVSEDALLLLINAERSLNLSLNHRLPTGRVGQGRLSGSQQLEEQYGLFRLVSVTEAFLDAISIEVVGREVDHSIKEQALIFGEWEISSTSSWAKREDAFESFLSFRLKSCGGYRQVKAAVHVRNAIAHGLGRITARQRTTRTLASEVALIGVSVGGGQMLLGANTFSITSAACAELIRDVDVRVPLSV